MGELDDAIDEVRAQRIRAKRVPGALLGRPTGRALRLIQEFLERADGWDEEVWLASEPDGKDYLVFPILLQASSDRSRRLRRARYAERTQRATDFLRARAEAQGFRTDRAIHVFRETGTQSERRVEADFWVFRDSRVAGCALPHTEFGDTAAYEFLARELAIRVGA